MKCSKRSHCPIVFALDIFGDRWSLVVLRDLLFKGKCHYNEFLASEESISTNILSERLVRLENEGLITKTRHAANRREFIYAPTRKGMDLLPAILEICCWSAKYDPKTAAPPALMRRIQKDREGFIHEIEASFTESSENP